MRDSASHVAIPVRLVLLLLLFAAFVTLGGSACGGASTVAVEPSAASEPMPGGTYNFPLSANPVSIEPLNTMEWMGWVVNHQLFEGLVKYELQPDGSMKTVPCIAESWSANEDATVWTFKLKQGVRFSAPVSREVTADDFVQCLNYVTDPANESFVSYVLAPVKGAEPTGYAPDGLTGVRAIDPYTLEFTLNYPFAEFPVTLGHPVGGVFPVDYMKEIGRKAFMNKPVGTGPYMVEKWAQNRYIDLVKNPDYWDAASGGPYIDKVHMPVVPDTNTQWMMFQTGDLDASSVPPGQVKSSMEDPKVKSGEWSAVAYPALAVQYVGVNMDSPLLGGEENLLLRQALAAGADTDAIINVVSQGVPIEANGVVPLGIPGSDLSTLPYPPDAEKAAALADQAGSTATLKLWVNTDPMMRKVGEALVAGWGKAGIDVKMTAVEWNTFLEKVREGKEDDLFLLGWMADYPAMDNFLYPLFHSSQIGANNYFFYGDPEVDRLIDTARQTVDEKQRLDLYAQAEKIVLDDVALIPLFFNRNYLVSSNRIQGFTLSPMFTVDMWKLWVK